MKVMVFVKATPNSEAGLLPSDEATQKMFTEMGKFNEDLAKAGIIQAADGLKPSSAGKRLTFTNDGHASVIDGPFAETKELVAGFWLVQMKSMAEAKEWFSRAPFRDGEIEIRQVFESADFEPVIKTDAGRELLAKEDEFRKQHG